MRGSGGAENAILANDELLDTVCGTNLCNGLGDLGVPVTAVTTNDEGRVLDTLGDGEEDAGDERLRVVLLLEDLDLLTKTGAGSKSAHRYKQANRSKLRKIMGASFRREDEGKQLTFRASGPGKA
jgi:hypothetical protein